MLRLDPHWGGQGARQKVLHTQRPLAVRLAFHLEIRSPMPPWVASHAVPKTPCSPCSPKPEDTAGGGGSVFGQTLRQAQHTVVG